jgi:hypothetical protein
MKKTLLLTLSACALLAGSASAKDFKLPNEDFGIATISIPDSWKPSEIDNGVEATSPDDAVYIAADAVGSDKGVDAEIDDTFKMLKEHKVKLDQSSKKENKFKINGLDADELLFQGTDEDGPTAVSIVFVTVKDKLVVLTYWVTTAEEKKNYDTVMKIVNSLVAK